MSQDSQKNLTVMSQETLKHIFESLEAACVGDDAGDFTKIIDHKSYEKEEEGDEFKYQFNFECIRPVPPLLQHSTNAQLQIRASPPVTAPICLRSEYDGPFGFQVVFGEQPKDTKSTPWSYASTLKKLYARKDALCPISFYVTKDSHPGLTGLGVRAMLVFDRVEHSQDVVKRCPNHIHSSATDVPHKEHFLWCESPIGVYQTDSQGRYSVVVPFEQMSPCIYAFKCLSSCVGGPNRRGMTLIFTLETATGDVAGRRIVDVKICSCPGRDRKTDEARMVTFFAQNHRESPAAEMKSPHGCSMPNTPVPQAKENALPSPAACPVTVPVVAPQKGRIMEIETYQLSKKPRLDEDVYVLYVKGRQDFELLRKIRDSLAVARAVPVHEQEANVHSYHQSEGLLVVPSDRLTECAARLTNEQMPLCVANPLTPTPTVSSKASITELPPNPVIPRPDHASLTRDSADGWLRSNGFPEYIDTFLAQGFVYMDQLSSKLTLNDLEKMDIRKNDRNRIWRNLCMYRKNQFVEAEASGQGSGHIDVVPITRQFVDHNSQNEASSQRSTSSQSSSFFPGLFELTRCSLKVKVSKDSVKS